MSEIQTLSRDDQDQNMGQNGELYRNMAAEATGENDHESEVLIAELAEKHHLGPTLDQEKMTHNSGSEVWIVNNDYVVKIFPGTTDPLVPAKEAALCEALRPQMPTPDVIGSGPSIQQTLRPYIIEKKMPGETLEHEWDSLSEEQQRAVSKELGRDLAIIHTLPMEDVAEAVQTPQGSKASNFQDRAVTAVEKVKAGQLLNSGQVEAIESYFASKPADNARPGLIHGSYRFGNVLTEGGEITGVLDWEDAAIGDTHEELGLTLYRTIPEAYHEAFMAGYTAVNPEVGQIMETMQKHALLFYMEHLPDIESWTEFPGKRAYYRHETARILADTIGDALSA